MLITKRAISRRTFLRGAGTALALPLLDAMVPAGTALAKTAANPVRRLGVVYVSNGMAMEYWSPKTAGAGFEFTPILQPLKPFETQLVVISGLRGPYGSSHASASTGFLTGVGGQSSYARNQAATSIDQIAAKEWGKETQVASLELALDAATLSGTCEQISCIFQNTISWRGPTTPQTMEPNPRVIFERLFGDSGTTESKARLRGLRRNRSILDSLTERIAEIEMEIGPGDRAKLTEYVDAVRDVERRIQRAEEQSNQELPLVNQPIGIPTAFDEHARLMYDLQVLAYQCDLTRVFTMMIGRESGGRSYPEIGVSEAHHPLSHHMYDPIKIQTLSKINSYHTSLFAYFLDRMRSTPDGDGSLLDHALLLYGAGISDSNAHRHDNLPTLLVGGASGRLKGGRHLMYPETPAANLLVTILDKLDIRLDGDKMGENGTGKLDIAALPEA